MPSQEPVSVITVGEQDWVLVRDLRLAMLLDSPDAFWTTYAEVVDRDEAAWRQTAARPGTLQARDPAGRPLGTLTVLRPENPEADGLRDDDALVLAVYVVPEARGTGVADLLLGVAERMAREDLAASRLVLHVSELNQPALDLYLRNGFRATGNSIAHPRLEGVRELELARTL